MSRAARVGYALAALLTAAVFALLGTWQLGRGLAKQDRLEREASALKVATPAELALEAARQDAVETVTRVAGAARYVQPLLLLDNQQRQGKVGLRVYAQAVQDATPNAPRLLVDLGWVPLPPDRRLPALSLPEGERAVQGMLVPWPGQGLRLAPTPWPSVPTQPVLLNTLDRADIEHALGVTLASRVLRLAPEADHGYARDLEALPNTLPPERHFGYSAQWFGLAATVIVVYVVLSWRARRRVPSQ